MKPLKPTIGMEVHVELATDSKMFCGCRNGMGQETVPNKNICPVCTGQPGALPVPNEKAIEFVIRAGLALACRVSEESKFDRKNYFYPDLPKGYQISQYDQPLCRDGVLDFLMKDGKRGSLVNQVRIHRIHLEEDTGKLIHQKGTEETLVDFNRAGVPLMELVTEADIKSSAQAKKFCEELRLLFRYIGISPADMEKGQMRCEANISLHEEGADPLSGTKVELKNLNSFKAVERGIDYEIKRQTELLGEGKKVIQETRGWDEARGATFSQRSKEDAHDYRYFPEPDIRPLRFADKYIELIRDRLPELPAEKRIRFVKEFGLSAENAEVLVASKELADFFEQAVSEMDGWLTNNGHDLESEVRHKVYQLAANYIITELSRMMFETSTGLKDLKMTAENFAELITITFEGRINSSATQTILREMFEKGGDPSHIIEEKNLGQISDEESLVALVDEVLAKNTASVEDYKKGKQNAIKFLMGQVMAESKGKANPQLVMKLLSEKLK